MVSLCLDGNFAEARIIHEKMLPVIQSIFAEGSPSGVKYYLSKLNTIKESFRLPVVSVSNNHKTHIDELMKTMS